VISLDAAFEGTPVNNVPDSDIGVLGASGDDRLQANKTSAYINMQNHRCKNILQL